MKRQLPFFIVFLGGAFMVVQYFIPHESSEFLYEFIALGWVPIIGVFALSLGVVSLVRVSIARIRKRGDNWQYSLLTLAGLAFMLIAGFPGIGNQTTPVVRWGFQNLLLPVSSSMFAILAFFMASAAYRAFRARSVLASVLLAAAIIVMLRFSPLGPLTEPMGDAAGWILNVPNLAAKRAIVIGVGLGAVATALKIVLGIERSYMGRD
jgi:hypothetical protein